MGRLCLVGAVAAVMGAPTRAALGSPPLACGSWTIVPSPDAGSNGSTLAGVSAPSRRDVWAVGYRQDSFETPRQTLALHWEGSAWSVVTTPNGTGDNYLWNVRARTPVDVWAVGSYSVPWFQTLAEHWDGTSWAVVPTP